MPEIEKRFRYWSYKRQYLGKRGTKVELVLRDVIGVYSSHPSAPLSLHARVRSFDEKAFRQLDKNRLAFRVPAMRLTVYMLPRETAHIIFSATIPGASDPVWEKRYSQKNRFISREDYKNWKEEILQLTDNPLKVEKIKKATGIPDASVKLVLNRMAFEGSLLRIGAESLHSNIISYVSVEAWAAEHFTRVENNTAMEWLAGEYLRAFGPIRIKDFQWWAGISASKAKMAISAHETAPVGNGYLLLANDIKEFETFRLPSKDRLDILPQWDSYMMGYAPDGRERFVNPDMQHHIYGLLGATGGNALGTLLINGKAHGSWKSRFVGNQMKVILNMFDKPTSRLDSVITDRFNEIALLLRAKRLIIQKRSI